MARSLKKGPYIDERLLKKLAKIDKDSKEIVKTWNRAATIVPEMIGYTLGVYNGKVFVSVKTSEDMVGHKLGEFAPTRKFIKHGGRMAREEEQEAKFKETIKAKDGQKEEAIVQKPQEKESK